LSPQLDSLEDVRDYRGCWAAVCVLVLYATIFFMMGWHLGPRVWHWLTSW
jgi:hypothetical protein